MSYAHPNIYQEHGFSGRRHYLRCLAEDYGVELEVVLALANVLGPSEDFDGLVNALEDASDEI